MTDFMSYAPLIRAMVRLDLLYSDRLHDLRSFRAMIRLDLLSDRLHVLCSSRAMVRLDLLYSARLHVLRSSRAMVRLDLLYSDRLQVLRSSRAMVRLDLLYGDRLDVLRSSRAMVRLDLLYSDRLHVLRSSAVDVPLCVLHCCEGVVLPMFLWRNKSSTPYSNPVSIKPDALDMDSWRGIPGRRGPHPCGNSTEWILEQGWFPPRS